MNPRGRTLKRGAYQRAGCSFIGAWFPESWVREIDVVVVEEDLDRSKVLRRAVQSAIERRNSRSVELEA